MIFEVIQQNSTDMLYKFVLTMNGEPLVAIIHRNLENWGDLTGFLKNTYTEKRMLYFHAIQPFGPDKVKT